MHKTLKVAQREYIETAKTKTFILMIVMLPVMIGVIVFFLHRLNRPGEGARPPMRIAVTDLSDKLSAQLKTSFDEHNSSHPDSKILLQDLHAQEGSATIDEQARAKLRRGELDAYIVLDADILQGTGKIRIHTHKPKPGDIDSMWAIENTLRGVIVNQRIKERNLSPDLLEGLYDVQVEKVAVGSEDEAERVERQRDTVARMLVPFFFMYLLFLGIITMGQHMLSSVIEEKNSRVMEVLLAALSPFEIMAGKILGLVGIGLSVVALWGVTAYAAARWQGLTVEIAPVMLPYFVVYYVLAFLLFGSFMVGVGSICNTIKETQSLMMPVMLCCVVPLIAWQNIIREPGSTLARGFSFFPPTTPMVMILRLSAGFDVPMAEVLASIVLLAAAVLATMWVAAKVFRTGILMYGKRPSLLEVARWLRHA
jgi:ABC-2 type transport system permease protein